jgi:hypothetical protein
VAAALSGRPHAGPVAGSGPQRYWAPCLAVALVAMFLFYVALTDLVKESASRAPAQAVAMPAVVQAPLMTANAEVTLPVRVAAVPVRLAQPPVAASAPIVATPVRFEVTKCVTPSGEAEYSDGPCSEGARATTLRLQ